MNIFDLNKTVDQRAYNCEMVGREVNTLLPFLHIMCIEQNDAQL